MQFKELVRIAYTEGEISEIIGRGVFCAHKPYNFSCRVTYYNKIFNYISAMKAKCCYQISKL